MRIIERKTILISIMVLSAGTVLSTSNAIAQNRGQESHVSRATTAQEQQNWNGDTSENQGSERSERLNSGERVIRNGHGNNNSSWEKNGNRDDRGRDGNRHDRGRHERKRNDDSSGFYGGGYYPYGYYSAGYYNGTSYGSKNDSPFDIGYADGFNSGKSDRNQGNLFNPRQYERQGNPDYFEGFVAGYEDAFRR